MWNLQFFGMFFITLWHVKSQMLLCYGIESKLSARGV